MSFIKENLHLDVPTEFVEGTAHDVEEIYLMSLCKHNIIPQSTFSWWGAWLNQNPDKKVFGIYSSTADKVATYRWSLTTPNQDSILDSAKWIWVPFDKNKCLENITQRPIFSLLLVVNDAANLPATLDSLLNQDYKYYEVIIIDNASTDGSDKICRQAVKGKDNVTYKRLRKKISNATAWNRAFKVAQGRYVFFLKVGDRFLNDSLTKLYPFTENRVMDNIIHMIDWLKEDENGNIAFADKKFSAQRDERLKSAIKMIPSRNGYDAAKFLLNRQINSFLGTKLYNVEFIKEHEIKFDETLADDEAEIFFQTEAFFKTKYFMYVPYALYVLPKI